jgi:DNA-binding GntR family transcriptional regulator
MDDEVEEIVYSITMTSMLSPIDLLQKSTLATLVQDELLRMIKAGEIVAGNKLTELNFVRRLKVSRAPIREAFRALGEAGLLRLEKNRGVFVRELSETEAAELYAVRAGLDEMVGRMLAPVITDADIAELRVWLQRFDSTAETGTFSEYFALNIAFHDRIVAMVGNTTLLRLYRQVIDRMHLLRRQSFSTANGSGLSRLEHGEIVEALATHDPKVAEQAMGTHVRHGYQRMLLVGMDRTGPQRLQDISAPPFAWID